MRAKQSFPGRAIDLSTLVGVVLAFAMVILAIVLGGNPNGFIDLRSILIVLFGTLAVTTACFSVVEVARTPVIILQTIFYRREKIRDTALRAMELAEIARNKGTLVLENYESLTAHNTFFKDGIRMVSDNVPPEEVEKVLNHEVHSMLDRHDQSISVLQKAAEISPAMGLIGTLIGLVQMLGNLEDVSTLGPAMAVALLTTFYGAVLSYMVFSPLASKLERNTRDEMLRAKIYIQAVISISKQENPRNLEMVINGILPPTGRISYFAIKRDKAKGDMQELLNTVSKKKDE